MNVQCPRCAANSDRCREEYKGLAGDTVVWTVYHCLDCSFTWRDCEPDTVVNHGMRQPWANLTSLDPEIYPHNIPPPDAG